jgi:hypothetical protein
MDIPVLVCMYHTLSCQYVYTPVPGSNVTVSHVYTPVPVSNVTVSNVYTPVPVSNVTVSHVYTPVPVSNVTVSHASTCFHAVSCCQTWWDVASCKKEAIPAVQQVPGLKQEYSDKVQSLLSSKSHTSRPLTWNGQVGVW